MFGMRPRSGILVFMGAATLFVVVSGWLASEDPHGMVPEPLAGLGDFVVWPGWTVDMMLSRSLSGFGGWRSGSIRILISWLVWGSPFMVLGWLLDRFRDHLAKDSEG
jgi:hypothetical protein